MRGSLNHRGVLGAVAVAAVAWAVFALAAPAQQIPIPEPMPPKPLPLGLVPKAQEERTPPAIEDPDVLPAQFAVPGGAFPPASPPGRTVADPPAPVVRIQVRVAADSAPADDIKYIITVQNTSTANAHGVMVRNPLPDSIDGPVKAEPEWDKTRSVAKDNVYKELRWYFGTLAPGKSKTIELVLRPKKDASEVKNLAYVQFEHGEVVTTKINKPTLKVQKAAPKQIVRDEPYTVRIAVDNTGKVPAENVRVVENLPTTAEVEPVTKGGKRTDKKDAGGAGSDKPPALGAGEGQQWVWEIAKLMPGERKLIEYRVTARESKDVFALTSLAADKGVNERAEARTVVLVPGLTVKLTGPSANAPVNAGEAAKYEITVRNTGTLPSTTVRVTGTLPADCKPTMKTEGGQLYRDAIQWVIPRLEPSEAQTFRFAVKANTSGPRVVVASVSDARGQRAADELRTLFQGTAALVWESIPDPVALSVGKKGTFTVRVRNNGGEAARNVRLTVEVPDAVSYTDIKPNVKPSTAKLIAFPAETIAGNGESVYTITYEAKQSAQAWFKLSLTADCLGERPMTTEKSVEITGGG